MKSKITPALLVLCLLLLGGLDRANCGETKPKPKPNGKGKGKVKAKSSSKQTSVSMRGKLIFPEQVMGVGADLPQVKILIDGGKKEVYSRLDSTFEVHNLPQGSHSLDISHPMIIFPPYKVTVLSDSRIRLSFVHPKTGKQESTQKHTKPFTFMPMSAPMYFQPRKQISIMSMLMNPMILMMGFLMLMMFAMPKMMGSLDPEELKKLQEEQAKARQDADPSKLMNGAMASMLGVKQAEDSDSDSD